MPKHVIITYYRRKRLPFANTEHHGYHHTNRNIHGYAYAAAGSGNQ